MSRAGVVDFPELRAAGRESGRTPRRHRRVPRGAGRRRTIRVRRIEGLLLSAHRTGGMPEALFEIGRMTVADAELILRGLPPQLCRRADARRRALRSKPAAVT